MNGDPIKPGLQAAFAVEPFHAAKDLQKHFLGSVRRICRVGQNAVHKAVDRLMIVRNQPVVSLLRARFELRDNRGLLSSYADRAGDVTQCCSSRHFSHGVTPFSQDMPTVTTGTQVTAVTTKGTAVLLIDRPR